MNKVLRIAKREYLATVRTKGFILGLVLACATSLQAQAQGPPPVPYDIVYVRAPRAGDNAFVELPEVLFPVSYAAGADLMLLHPDGSEEVLVPSDGDSSYADPMISFDGLWCYYVKFHDQNNLQGQRPGDPFGHLAAG